MFIPTRIALAAALILGSVSATLAANIRDDHKALRYGRGSYAQVPVPPGPNDATPWYATGAVRPLTPPMTPFEWNWFEYQKYE